MYYVDILEMHNVVLYAEVNIIAIAMIGFIQYKLLHSSVNLIAKDLLLKAGGFAIGFMLMDSLWKGASVGFISESVIDGYIINTVYFICINLTYGHLIGYFIRSINGTGKLIKGKKYYFNIVIPYLINILFHISNIIHHGIYTVEKTNIGLLYKRGPLYPFSIIVPFGSLVGISIYILHANSKMKSDDSGFCGYDKIIRFCIVTSVASVVNLFEEIFPFFAIMLAFEINILYMKELEITVSLDPLTHISNKREFLHTLKKYTEDVKNDVINLNLYLIMIDLNFFKNINDKYGHAEGDVALIRVARALKSTCANFPNNKIIISRFGGDEFSVFLLSESNKLVSDYITKLDENIRQLKKKDNAEYDINLACGYYKYTKDMTVRDFMDLADNNLYENKRRYHIAHGRKMR